MNLSELNWFLSSHKIIITKYCKLFIIIILAWVIFTNTIQRFKNPCMSEFELFLHIPKSFILDFKTNN